MKSIKPQGYENGRIISNKDCSGHKDPYDVPVLCFFELCRMNESKFALSFLIRISIK